MCSSGAHSSGSLWTISRVRFWRFLSSKEACDTVLRILDFSDNKYSVKKEDLKMTGSKPEHLAVWTWVAQVTPGAPGQRNGDSCHVDTLPASPQLKWGWESVLATSWYCLEDEIREHIHERALKSVIYSTMQNKRKSWLWSKDKRDSGQGSGCSAEVGRQRQEPLHCGQSAWREAAPGLGPEGREREV